MHVFEKNGSQHPLKEVCQKARSQRMFLADEVRQSEPDRISDLIVWKG
jgi:hypothetical protein